jgi:hypothetical protein
MKPRLSEFSLRYLIVRELSQLPTFRSGFAFELSANQGSWEATPFRFGNVECSGSLQAICSRLRSKFDLQDRHSKA